MTPSYALAEQAVFATLQGEGLLAGLPMVFVRFAGCPVGCADCDTDYGVKSRVGVEELVRRVVATATPSTGWVWLTGGEPTIHDLNPLVAGLHKMDFRVALATAGINPVVRGRGYVREKGVSTEVDGVDFVSVSPHKMDASWVQRRGEQINLVFGLNGLTPDQCRPYRQEMEKGFDTRFVTPMYGNSASEEQCRQWVWQYPGWRIGLQQHKVWGVP